MILYFSFLLSSIVSGSSFRINLTTRAGSPRTLRSQLSDDMIPKHFKWFDSQISRSNFESPKLFDMTLDTTESQKIKEIPIFPFDFGVAFPTGEFPLNIFVMSYRMMMNDINKHDKLFGIVVSDGEGKFGEIGTLLINEKQILQDDGRQLCINKCLNRFKILEIVKTTPYIVAKVFTLYNSNLCPSQR